MLTGVNNNNLTCMRFTNDKAHRSLVRSKVPWGSKDLLGVKWTWPHCPNSWERKAWERPRMCMVWNKYAKLDWKSERPHSLECQRRLWTNTAKVHSRGWPLKARTEKHRTGHRALLFNGNKGNGAKVIRTEGDEYITFSLWQITFQRA